jgi:hypothetical protein
MLGHTQVFSDSCQYFWPRLKNIPSLVREKCCFRNLEIDGALYSGKYIRQTWRKTRQFFAGKTFEKYNTELEL